MCETCWVDLGAPKIKNAKTERLCALVDNLYDYAGAGGHLHIVVDDWNLDDDDIEFCEKYIVDSKDKIIDQCLVELQIIDLMKEMSMDERASGLALHDGFFE